MTISILRSLLYFMCVALLARCGGEAKHVSTPYNEVGNGGDACELEYRAQIPAAVAWFAAAERARPVRTSATAFRAALEGSKVQCVDETLSAGGWPKTALSFVGQRLTKVNRPRWQASASRAKLALVVHEGLVLAGGESTNEYAESVQVLGHEVGFGGFVCMRQGVYLEVRPQPRTGEGRPQFISRLELTAPTGQQLTFEVGPLECRAGTHLCHDKGTEAGNARLQTSLEMGESSIRAPRLRARLTSPLLNPDAGWRGYDIALERADESREFALLAEFSFFRDCSAQ